tara:strand:- start:82 stop:846 length:765 start_codon:yes stop_codon:yes gene_type:complete
MATVLGANGRIEMFEDFLAGEDIVANTAVGRSFGGSGFRVIGQGSEDTDSGITVLESDGLNGVGDFTTTNEVDHTIALTTGKVFDVGKMGTIVAEIRVQFADLDTKEFYFGFTDVNGDTAILEGENVSANASDALLIDLHASDLCGFFLSAELTDDEDWHMVYNGGTTTGETTAANIDADDDAVAGEFQVLRLEIANNGTARWYIDGVLKQTKTGAISTSTDVALIAMLEAKTAAIEHAYVDYLYVSANRDWTV